MIQLHPSVDMLPSDQLKANLLWFMSHADTVESRSSVVDEILAETQDLEPPQCYELLTGLTVKEMVGFTLVNEFGHGFVNRPAFPMLIREVSQRLG